MSTTKLDHHRIALSMFATCKDRGELDNQGRILRTAEQTIFLLDTAKSPESEQLLTLVALQFAGLLGNNEVDSSWYFPPWPLILQNEAEAVDSFISYRSDDVLGLQGDGMPVATVIPISRKECFPYPYLETSGALVGLAKILNVGFYKDMHGLLAPIWIMPDHFFETMARVTYPKNPNKTIWEWQRMGVRRIK